jgi:hypothetical protein
MKAAFLALLAVVAAAPANPLPVPEGWAARTEDVLLVSEEGTYRAGVRYEGGDPHNRFGAVELRLDEGSGGPIRGLLDVYRVELDGEPLGLSVSVLSVEGGGGEELVVELSSMGNDVIASWGLAVLRPSPEGWVELFRADWGAPKLVDVDSDGVPEITTEASWWPGNLARVETLPYLHAVYSWDGDRYVRADPADYGWLFLSEGEEYFGELEAMLSPDGVSDRDPHLIQTRAAAVLIHFALGGLEDRYADAWRYTQERVGPALQEQGDGWAWRVLQEQFDRPPAEVARSLTFQEGMW